MCRIALVTCRNSPEPDPDELLLLDACRASGLAAEYVAWEEESVDWASFDLAVLRSTWNFYEHEAAFRRFILRVASATRLVNPAELVLRTIHKRYLADLASLGTPIVPTRFIDRRSERAVREVIRETGWREFVVKPAVSASSFMTKRFAVAEIADAELFKNRILEDRDAMVQLFLPNVAKHGEISLVHIDGEITHGVMKQARYAGDVESVSAAIQPSAEQRAIALRAIETVKEPWLYARTDLMQRDDGSWVLSELEVIEPSLFFLQFPPALDRFVAAILRVAQLSTPTNGATEDIAPEAQRS